MKIRLLSSKMKLQILSCLASVLIFSGGIGLAQDITGTTKIMNTISNPLRMDNGKLVKTKNDWLTKRRPELLDFFTTQVYGQSPDVPPDMKFVVTDLNSTVFEGLATRKQITVQFEGKNDGQKMGIQTLYPELQNRPDNFSAMGAWAWGLSRAMDYLETDAAVDAERVIIFGTSRFGKAALWAGAKDERFAMVISNESGAGGAKLYHHKYNEDIAQICRVFPYWFSNDFQKYNDKDTELPFDQHLMMSLIAPRPLLIASAKEAYVCDPYGEFLGALATSPVYDFLGRDPLPIKSLPKENNPAFGTLGYYMRSGKHDIVRYDWQQFINFANLHLKN